MDTKQPDAASEVTLKVVGGKLPVIATALSSLVLVGYIMTQQPGSGGPIVMLGFLLLVFLSFVSFTALFLQLVIKLVNLRFTPSRLFYTSVLLGLGGVFLVGLQTLRQLQIVDVVLVLLFEVLLNFYLLRRF